MRRKSFYLLVLSLFLLFLPILKDDGIHFGVADYSQDISSFLQLVLGPSSEPVEVKYLAALYIFQSLGWIFYASSLFLLALYGLIRNSAPLKSAALLSALVLVHGLLEVTLSVLLTSLAVTKALFTRFGLDLADFMDDYDALLNSTLVPIALIVWFFLNSRTKKPADTHGVVSSDSQLPTENS
jgi:hypothetical protein